MANPCLRRIQGYRLAVPTCRTFVANYKADPARPTVGGNSTKCHHGVTGVTVLNTQDCDFDLSFTTKDSIRGQDPIRHIVCKCSPALTSDGLSTTVNLTFSKGENCHLPFKHGMCHLKALLLTVCWKGHIASGPFCGLCC